jgi:hypothetical protein
MTTLSETGPPWEMVKPKEPPSGRNSGQSCRMVEALDMADEAYR